MMKKKLYVVEITLTWKTRRFMRFSRIPFQNVLREKNDLDVLTSLSGLLI